MLGAEVQGSCQNINDQPNLNKCLLGYMINGESQAIVIKDGANRIVGRGMAKLLSDNEENPVLFLERLYLNKRLRWQSPFYL